MNEFEQRWQQLAKQATGLLDESLPELPFGFTARVLARVLARSRDTLPESYDDVLSALGLRAVWLTLGACVVAAGLFFSEWYEVRIPRLEVEHSFTPELSWP